MKVLVFSDSHLDHNFEPKKLSYLKKLVRSVDQVIINGDFWEGYSITFDQFLSSKWNELFPLLKAKKAVYIFGNHDKKVLADKRMSQFCAQSQLQYKLKTPRYTYVFEHGNRLAPYIDDIWNLRTLPPVTNNLLGELEGTAVRIFGAKALTYLYGRFNKKIKGLLKHELKKNEVFVCGHTHVAEVDLKNQFINDGLIRHGLAHHLIIEDGVPTLYRDRYR
ncbi:hypothetical protein A3G67_01820 [Candidatus Roizmanbacteria bacterium RIFCSPLOWO2_12_FULL_40_12]|uniref:Calcineurin-like phosphoesterase domain-containing protein n=1 Tax=Candidatus Roizmanbacteria bacterium RIFCSPLOWO2_01_FULL_40_42 TaxID=1802066 RepID=A0A1F7J3G4_9BACT|nr:MAG: hypothetical protein A2779_00940 [Candidatus Roizmanbacteria bacterium RIFCSPHIGHO2_01_FULL_40_98]OGK28932.1 MAG: hypothetical protein A3C31_01580 [Candidatus Roizmanbacteria bacterium RIFCSPHIGHO2_02_FULL_40_53]OGK29602.1 MAG: hypothetical protein A2W49_03960 [Candidatus Roizmanbacteria bacterium RIFCSPHIGHO2_12_41_18]OGK36693.1 MAG: hypothetical protein A3E69_03780 [Candidatus Roizmanbacteria bacterium RIFCSPHIGHO2_12_FULL_40_130]OGK50161.1 MAG: hypothetical protein A3B50_00035 [Candi